MTLLVRGDWSSSRDPRPFLSSSCGKQFHEAEIYAAFIGTERGNLTTYMSSIESLYPHLEYTKNPIFVANHFGDAKKNSSVGYGERPLTETRNPSH